MLFTILLTIANAFTSYQPGELKSASTLVEDYFKTHQKDMTLDFALKALGKDLPDKVKDMLSSGGEVTKKSVRSTLVFLENEKKHLKEGKKGSGWTTEELDRAIEILNKMYDQEQADLDITLVDCTKFENAVQGQLDENSRLRTVMAAETDSAVEQKLQAKKTQKEASSNLEELTEQHGEHQKACSMTLNAGRAQLAIAEFDLKVAMKIQEQAECDDDAIAEAVTLENEAAEKEEARLAALGTSVLQTKANSTHKAFTVSECRYSGHSESGKGAEEEGQLQFGGVMQQYATQFKSKEAWWAMQRAAKMALKRDLGKHSYSHTRPRASFLQASSTTGTTTEDILDQEPATDLSAMSGEEEALPAGPSADTAAAYKCNVNAVPNCPLLSDAISVMVGEIRATYTEIKKYVDETQAHCDELSAEFEAQIKTNENNFEEAGIELVEAGKIISTNQFNTEQKQLEFTSLDAELQAKQKECGENILALQDTMCGIKIIRLELLQMASDDRIVADCEVGDWIPDECSVSCAGGMQTMNRKIVVEANMGASCPPLAMEQTCNDFPCPIDCELDEWAGWSACTADCGGGSTSRSRNIVTKPMYKGEECGETSAARSCNEDSCNADCELAPWGGWSSCSKTCTGEPVGKNPLGIKGIAGIQTSTRAEISPARGTGICADPHSPERFSETPCNDHQCPDNVVCNTKLDIVLLFDSSGSVGSKGFASEKEFGANLLNRFNINEDAAKVGIVKYSKSVMIAQPMTFDSDVLKTKVEELTWDASTTSTSIGMSYALDVLTAGAREDADNLVFVITDGMPNDSEATSLMSDKVKQVAKLIFVAVGKNLDQESLDQWASFPPEQNIFHAKGFKHLDNHLTEFISGMCPALECREDMTGDGADYIGCQSTTVSGKQCMKWSATFPHTSAHPDLTDNFCRNPDGSETIWCYTTDSEVERELCAPRASNAI